MQTNTLSVYGPKLWYIIHVFCYKYKSSMRSRACFLTLIYSIQELIPCIKCRTHFQENLKQFPPTEAFISTDKGLFLWSYLMHERVNKQLGKKGIPYGVALEIYANEADNYPNIGRNLWHVIHTFASGYQGNLSQKVSFTLFMECISKLAPWNVNFWLDKLPLTSDRFVNTESLLMWTYMVHDIVNQALNKTSPTFNQVKEYYLSRCRGENNAGCDINFS